MSINSFIFLTLPVVFLVLYVRAALRQQRWQWWRVASFCVGTGILLVAATPIVAEKAHHDLRWHMVQHLLIGMLAPIGLVLGAPLMLTLRSVNTGTARSLARLMRLPLFRLWSHPFSALLFNIGGMYVLYLTPLYMKSQENSWLHYFVHYHFLVAGYLFTWAILGTDGGRRYSATLRISALFLAVAAHSTLSKLMYIHLLPAHIHSNPDEIRSAALLMYYGGDVVEFLLAVLLFSAWYTKRRDRNWRPSRATVSADDYTGC